MERITGGEAVECHLIFNTVYFCFVTDLNFGEDKAQRMAADLHVELSKMYKGNLEFIRKQSNLKPNVFDKVFKSNFTKVLENYQTAIKTTNVNAAMAKADEVKAIAARSVNKMHQNMEET